MTKQDLTVPAGRLFCFSSGEYSDYSYEGHFVALVDITPETFNAVTEAIKAKILSGEFKRYGEPVTSEDDWEFSSLMKDNFLPEFLRSGAALEVDCKEIHIGSYDSLDLT